MKIKVWKLTHDRPRQHSETLYKTEDEAVAEMGAVHLRATTVRPYDEKGVLYESPHDLRIVWSDGEIWEWKISEEEFEIPDPKPEPRKVWALFDQQEDYYTLISLYKTFAAASNAMDEYAKEKLSDLWECGANFCVDVQGDRIEISIAGILDFLLECEELEVQE